MTGVFTQIYLQTCLWHKIHDTGKKQESKSLRYRLTGHMLQLSNN
jgi:hypothetical protein